MKFHCLTDADRPFFQPQIQDIEGFARYPLGDDFFKIEHGKNYFAFFDRLGEVDYYIALDGDRLAAVGAGIFRQIPNYGPAWYLCDLKVVPEYEHRNLSSRILRFAVNRGIKRCDRGYVIFMNFSDNHPHRLVRIYQCLRWVEFDETIRLNIYHFDCDRITRLEPLLIKHRGPISYLSLKGIKDLRVQSNGQILPLLHVQWGATHDHGHPNPVPGSTHMFCAPDGDPLAMALNDQGIQPNATATIVSQNMDDSNWQFILTSEI
ncbi:GNAT family N-acetyltransferase [Geitlerinema sp. P-1104]|uniref:GNAT family N-acetyltransferase n=1 Tax=Geitlerinema sp. P-1104 TaxID=2546230 RepID=UPI0014777AE7|nr:GNAT family N-acetyltransferase [Geitlerinema sp. P-1104]NMG59548.1 GNAT family N-acetyltransferase [Geitlerinema sp. P-1104]